MWIYWLTSLELKGSEGLLLGGPRRGANGRGLLLDLRLHTQDREYKYSM